MPHIVTDKRCDRCKFVHMERDGYTCRKNPPAGHPVMAMTKAGPQCVASIGVFPSVGADNFCWEFVRRVSIATEIADAAPGAIVGG